MPEGEPFNGIKGMENIHAEEAPPEGSAAGRGEPSGPSIEERFEVIQEELSSPRETDKSLDMERLQKLAADDMNMRERRLARMPVAAGQAIEQQPEGSMSIEQPPGETPQEPAPENAEASPQEPAAPESPSNRNRRARYVQDPFNYHQDEIDAGIAEVVERKGSAGGFARSERSEKRYASEISEQKPFIREYPLEGSSSAKEEHPSDPEPVPVGDAPVGETPAETPPVAEGGVPAETPPPVEAEVVPPGEVAKIDVPPQESVIVDAEVVPPAPEKAPSKPVAEMTDAERVAAFGPMADLERRRASRAATSESKAEEGGRDERLETHGEMSDKERRERYEKAWTELSPEERKQKYEKSFELRERIHEMRQARANLVVAEHALGRKSISRVEEYLQERDKDRRLARPSRAVEEVLKSKKEQAYLAAREDFEKRRAEYVGAKAWRMLKDRKELAEAEGRKEAETLFERVRAGWRKLGDLNAERLMKEPPKSRFGKIAARVFSVRSGISWGLVGAAHLIPGVGMVALGARKVMTGTGTTFGTYDMMRRAHEVKTESVDDSAIPNMKTEELEERMAGFEALARFSGERVVQGGAYDALRREYKARMGDKNVEVLTAQMREADEVLRAKQAQEQKLARRQLTKAVGIGVIGANIANLIKGLGMAKEFAEHGSVHLDTSDAAALGEKVKNAAEAMKGASSTEEAAKIAQEKMSPQEWHRAFNIGGVCTAEEVEEGAKAGAQLPDHVLSAAEHGKALFEPQELVLKTPSLHDLQHAGEVSQNIVPEKTGEFVTRVEFPPPTIGTPHGDLFRLEKLAQLREISGTVHKGGSAWQAAKEIVKNGKITEEQFREAWSSPESLVKLPTGESVHISELGLTHAGDQVAYVPEAAGVPAHFEVLDTAADTYHVGSNEALHEAFQAAGKPDPKWLEEYLQAKAEHAQTAVEAAGPPSDEILSAHSSMDDVLHAYDRAQETAQAQAWDSYLAEAHLSAAEGAVDFAKEGMPLEWGGVARFVMDAHGNVADILFEQHLSPAQHAELFKKAAETLLKPEYTDVIKQSTKTFIGDQYHFELTNDMSDELWRNAQPRLQDRIIEYYSLINLAKALPAESSEAHLAITRAAASKNLTELLYGKVFK